MVARMAESLVVEMEVKSDFRKENSWGQYLDDLTVDQLVAWSVDWMVDRREKTMAASSVAVMAGVLVVQKEVRSAVTTVVLMDMRSVDKQVVR